jgi:hypothetical protein
MDDITDPNAFPVAEFTYSQEVWLMHDNAPTTGIINKYVCKGVKKHIMSHIETYYEVAIGRLTEDYKASELYATKLELLNSFLDDDERL